MRISVDSIISKKFGVEEVFLGTFFPRGFLQKVFDVLLEEYLRKKGVTSQLEAIRALYELVYGDESQWNPSVRKRFESAKLLLTGQTQQFEYEVKQEKQKEEQAKARKRKAVEEEETAVTEEQVQETERKEQAKMQAESFRPTVPLTEKTTEQVHKPVTELKQETKQEFKQETNTKQEGEGKVDREKLKDFMRELRFMAGSFGNFGKRSEEK